MTGKIGCFVSNHRVSEPPHFSNIPSEIILEIFRNTSLQTWGDLTATCTRFRAIVTSSDFILFEYLLNKEKEALFHNLPTSKQNQTLELVLLKEEEIAIADIQYYAESGENKIVGQIDCIAARLLQILRSLPRFIIFPLPESPMVPFMQSWFKEVKEKIPDSLGYKKTFHFALGLLRRKFYPSHEPIYQYIIISAIVAPPFNELYQSHRSTYSLYSEEESRVDRTFLQNLPLECLEADTLAEIQEVSRRFESHPPSSAARLNLDPFVDRWSCILRDIPNSRKVVLAGISSQLLQHILFHYTGKKVASSPFLPHFSQNYLSYAFEEVNLEDPQALEKLVILGNYYGGNWHRFEFHWENICHLFLLVMYLCKIDVQNLRHQNLKSFQFHPSINSERLLAWIPELCIIEMLNISNENLQVLGQRLLSFFAYSYNSYSYNRKKILDQKTIRDAFEFVRLIITSHPRTFYHWLYKMCSKAPLPACDFLLSYGCAYKRDYEQLNARAQAYHLLFCLLAAKVLIENPQNDPEHVLELKQALIRWIPQQYSSSESLRTFLELAYPVIQKSHDTSYPLCDLEHLLEFVELMRKEAAASS